MNDANMKLWNSVQKSDPKSIREVNFGRKFNTINAHHQVKRATEVFGPFGKGFGVTNERFFVPIDGLLIYQATFWWSEDGEDGKESNSFDISSSIATHMGKTPKLDDEIVKKVATDALTKGLSKLGFNADIFLGLWDDNRYVEKVKAEKDAEEKAPEIAALKEKSDKVIAEANKLAKKGDPDGIRKLYADNPGMKSVAGFMDAIVAAGKLAAEVKSKNTPKDAGQETEPAAN